MNSQHSNIRLTIETEVSQKLPFLDVLIDNSKEKPVTIIFRKKTFTGLFLTR